MLAELAMMRPRPTAIPRIPMMIGAFLIAAKP